MMRILMLSSDENIFKENSGVLSRILDYGKLVEELHVVIKSSQKINKKIGNVFLYSTNSYGLFYFWSAYKISKKILVATGQWLITSQDPFETGLIGYFLKRKFKLPLQIQIHTDFLSPYFWRESLKNKIRVILGKWLVKKADGIRVVSERIKNSLVASGYTLGTITVLPIFVDTQKIKNDPINTDLHEKYPNKFVILMASRLTKEKNIGLAIEVIIEVIKKYPQTLLLIVGNGLEEKNLKSQISNLKLEGNVTLENWTDDLSSYYKTADLFLLTSNYEGYGMTVVEATIAGLPVVMTDVGVALGAIVPAGNQKVLTDKLGLLIGGQVEREKTLEEQKKVLDLYNSKDEYLNLIKQSWLRCLASRILDSDKVSESEQNK